MIEETSAPEQSGEQMQDLAALHAMASDAPPLPGDAPEPSEPEKAPLADEISGMLKMLSAVVAPFFPTVAEIYSAERCDAIGEGVAPLCRKYGWLEGGIGGKYAEEIMAAVIVLPVAWSTVEAVKGDLAARRPKQEKTGAALAGADIERVTHADVGAPGQKTVTIGGVIVGGS